MCFRSNFEKLFRAIDSREPGDGASRASGPEGTYGRQYEMPQKASERYIFHVMAFHNQIGEMGHSKYLEHLKMGHFK